MVDKICLFCEHFVFHSGDYGWSDMTPGWDAEIYCYKRYWSVDLYEDSREKYRAKMLMAQSCKDYQEVKIDE